ncbi:MAG: FHA domain-containing protein [bacterium]
MQLKYTDSTGREAVLQLGADPVIIGRVPECDVQLADDRVSRHHCEIRAWDDVFVVRDLGSHNGTLINGQRTEIAVLKDGDKIGIGNTTVCVLGDSADHYRGMLREIVKRI